MRNQLLNEFWKAARQSPRIYFAPLSGAIQAIRNELTVSGSSRAKTNSQTSRPVEAKGK